MGIRNAIAKASGKAGDKVAKLAALSPQQVEEIIQFRDMYMINMPDPTDYNARTITENYLAAAGTEIYNAYLPQIKELYTPVESCTDYDGRKFNADFNTRYINITKWVTDKNEKVLICTALVNRVCKAYN